MESLRDRVITWAKNGGDLTAGVSVFLSYNANILYARNIEIKGRTRGTQTLVSEFSRKLKISERELKSWIEAWASLPSDSLKDRGVGQDMKDNLDRLDQLDKVAQKDFILAKPEETEQRKKAVSLREEFSFLKSPDCPDILAVLVNKMLTAYDSYRKNREQLFEQDFNDEKTCYDVARSVIDPFIQNRAIWDELNYYKIHGSLLGQTPEFSLINLRAKLELLSTVKLATELRSNIPRRISYQKLQLTKEQTDKKVIREKISEIEQEKQLIKEILVARGEMDTNLRIKTNYTNGKGRDDLYG